MTGTPALLQSKAARTLELWHRMVSIDGLGVLANTPLLPVANRKKTEAFVEDAQMPHSAANIHALTSELIECCLADRDAILKRMHHYQARTRNQARSPLADALG